VSAGTAPTTDVVPGDVLDVEVGPAEPSPHAIAVEVVASRRTTPTARFFIRGDINSPIIAMTQVAHAGLIA
jgi:hypothetical protein